MMSCAGGGLANLTATELQGCDLKRVLILEDDEDQARSYIAALEDAGWVTTWAASVADARNLASGADVILADRNLPDGDGLSLLAALTELGVEAPVIMLTSLNTLDERVRGLSEGAADYVGKGVDVREIVLRCESQVRNLRQITSARSSLVYIGAKEASPERRLVISKTGRLAAREDVFNAIQSKQDRQKHTLEPTAFAVLLHLAENKGRVVPAAELAEKFFYRTEFTDQSVRNVISKIRRSIDKDHSETFLHTQLGATSGYILRLTPCEPGQTAARQQAEL